MRTAPLATDEREAKLPVWAQELVKDLRRIATNATRERDEARLATNPYSSDAILQPYAEVPIGLGAEPNVRFKLALKEYVDVRLMDSPMRVLYVAGSDQIAIRPRSGNTATIEVSR